MKKMIKEYWDINKKIYGLYFLFQILMSIFYYFLQSNQEFAEFAYDNMAIDYETIPPILYWIIIMSFILGILSLAVTLIKFYIIIKPFIKKQLRQTFSLGNDPNKFILVHIMAVIIICLFEFVLIYSVNAFSTAGIFINSSFINSNPLEVIKTLCSSIAFPLWILTIPLIIMNGRVLSDMMPRKRVILITSSVLLLWFGISLIYLFPNLSSLLFYAQNIVEINSTIVNSTQIQILDLLVDLSGIFVFILAYNSFKNNYEIIV